MADVLIRGMEMPKGCAECFLADDECFGSYRCHFAHGWGNEETRAEGCPLVELKDVPLCKYRNEDKCSDYCSGFDTECDRYKPIYPDVVQEQGE